MADKSCEKTDSVAAAVGRKTENCMICSAALLYKERAVDSHCTYCNKLEPAHILCPNGHYICEQCHNNDAMQLVENIIFTTKSTDPGEIAEIAFSIDNLPMLGCTHAYIAGGSLMAALRNEGTIKINDSDIKEVLSRTEKQAHGGYCGLTGVCGVSPAIGACFSVLTGSKCGADKEQRITMEVVSKVTAAITKLTGPSCCKAYVRKALATAISFVESFFGVTLSSLHNSECKHSNKHPHGCRKSQCPYYSSFT